jgi:hypothetical protein
MTYRPVEKVEETMPSANRKIAITLSAAFSALSRRLTAIAESPLREIRRSLKAKMARRRRNRRRRAEKRNIGNQFAFGVNGS